MPTHDAELVVNTIKQQVASLARTIVDALKDHKLSSMEIMHISLQGMTLAGTVMTTLQGADDLTRADILVFLENGRITLD